jgi:predicted nucleic acid-binding protein
MPRYLLDTSALLAHGRRERGWSRVQALFDEPGAEVLAVSLSLTEFARRLLELGATAAEARQTVVAYQGVLDEVIPVDAPVALTAFDLGCETPKRLPLADALIAAAAHQKGAVLVHRDAHFVPIPANLVEQLDLSSEPDPA